MHDLDIQFILYSPFYCCDCCFDLQIHRQSEPTVWNQRQQSEALHQPQAPVSKPHAFCCNFNRSVWLHFCHQTERWQRRDWRRFRRTHFLTTRGFNMCKSHFKTPVKIRHTCMIMYWLLFLWIDWFFYCCYYRNLKDNNLSMLSWRTFQNFNATFS